METLKFADALVHAFKIIKGANKYIDLTSPFSLAKNPEKREYLNTVMYTILECIRISSVLLYPFIPDTAKDIYEKLSIKRELESSDLKQETKWGQIVPGAILQKSNPLFMRKP